MECDLCSREWDNTKHIPLILSCGHTYCQICLINIVTKSASTIFTCPSCRKEFKSIKTERDIKKLKKNNYLMKIYDKVELRKSSINMSMSFTMNNTEESNSNDINPNQNYNYYQLCNMHRNKCSYYIIENNEKKYYCEKCIDILYPEKFSPIPNLSKENESKLQSSIEKIAIIRNEIERIEKFLTSYMNNFDIQNTSKIDELYDYLNKVIQYNYTTTKMLFTQCKNEQKSHIDKKLNELALLKKDLCEYEKNIKILQKENIKERVLSIEKQIELNSLFVKLSNYLNYDNELNLFQIKIDIKNEMKENVFELIQDSYDFDIDFVKMKNGDIPTIKELLNKQSKWQCQCGNYENTVNTITCTECSRYRKLESYDYMIFNPHKVTSNELTQLNMRRKSEIKDFQSLMKCQTKTYCAIDIKWIWNWKCFVTNDLSEKYIKNGDKIISENKLIGVLPPGYITNWRICEKNKESNRYSLKQGVKNKEHFLVVNRKLWEWFKLNYEGGPEIEIAVKEKDDVVNSSEKEDSPIMDEGVKNIRFDPNNTVINDTILKINPISNYAFATKLSGFKLTKTPEKNEDDVNGDNMDNGEMKPEVKMKLLFDNIKINN